MNAPTKFAPNSAHAKYGLIKWLINRGIKSQELQGQIINTFCEQNNFISHNQSKRRELKAKMCFISNRFESFATWVGDNYKI